MNANGPDSENTGRQLYAAGWRQGSLFQMPTAQLAWNGARPVGDASGVHVCAHQLDPSTQLVLATHDCDLVSRKEPFVEALACHVEGSQHDISMLDKNSARRFLVDPARGLVAEAAERLLFAKTALLDAPAYPWPGGETRLRRFIRWLGRRYERPALPDSMVPIVQTPIAKRLDQFKKQQPEAAAAFTRAVQQIRVNLPATEEPPYGLTLVFLIEPDVTDEEAEALDTGASALIAAVDPDQVAFQDPRYITEEEMSLAEYFATRPLYLDYLSYEGEEIVGSVPEALH